MMKRHASTMSLGPTSLGLVSSVTHDSAVDYDEDETCAHDVDMFNFRAASDDVMDPFQYPALPGGPSYDRTVSFILSKRPANKIKTLFALVSKDHLQIILKFAIMRPSDRFNIACTCRILAQVSERISLIAHTAAVTTRPARLARNKAFECARLGSAAASSGSANLFLFEDGLRWRGLSGRSACPKGLGEFKKGDQLVSAGNFNHKGWEEGHCVMYYADGSRYAGEVRNGERHGFGVNESVANGQVIRYEGAWLHDKRHGFGLILGCPFRFRFGFWNRDKPQGKEVMWDYFTPDGSAPRC